MALLAAYQGGVLLSEATCDLGMPWSALRAAAISLVRETGPSLAVRGGGRRVP